MGVYREFEMQFPFIVERVVSWIETDYSEIVAKLDNGEYVLYDIVNKSLRTLPDEDSMNEEKYVQEFGRRIRRIMFINNVTQEELSERTGLSRGCLNRYINGKVMPSLRKAHIIAKGLRCTVNDLISY